MSEDTFRFPASIQVRATDDKLTDLLKKRVGEARLESGEPFFWSARISNTELDSYFTHMQPSTLKNYARDAKDGVPFQDSHNTRSIIHTLGRSLTGDYVPLNEDKYAEVMADFYTFRGRDPLIDSFINKTEDGLVNDVSVGFIPGKMICSICGKDMMRDWDCWHYPGFEYSKDARGEGEKILCTAAVEDGRLVEVSTVYAGSTPGAGIVKAQRMAEAGRMPVHEARRLEEVYNVRILGTGQVFLPLYSESTSEDRSMTGPLGDGTNAKPDTHVEIDTAEIERLVGERVKTLTDEATIAHNELKALLMSRALVKADTSLVECVRALADERDSLVAPAADGKRYRKDTIDAAIVQGVRALGDDFNEQAYRSLLEAPTMTLDIIQRMRDDWQRQGDKFLGSGAKIGSGAQGSANNGDKDENPARYRS